MIPLRFKFLSFTDRGITGRKLTGSERTFRLLVTPSPLALKRLIIGQWNESYFVPNGLIIKPYKYQEFIYSLLSIYIEVYCLHFLAEMKIPGLSRSRFIIYLSSLEV